MRNTASSRALRERFRFPAHKRAHRGAGISGEAFALASSVAMDVLGEGTTLTDGIFVMDITPAGLAVGRLGTRAATWASAAVTPTFLPSRDDWGEHISRALGINTQGDIVGMVLTTEYNQMFSDVDRVRLVRWGVDGSITDLPVPVAEAFYYFKPFITDAGDIYANIAPTVAGPFQIVRWHNGVPEIIASPPSLPDPSIVDVSRSGFLLAASGGEDFAVLAPDGRWITLQRPASNSAVGVRALTEDGGALGVASQADGTQQGARWSRNGDAVVDPLPVGLTRLSYLAQNGHGRLAGEGCSASGCSFYVLDRGDATPLPVPPFPGGGSFEHAFLTGLSDTDQAVGWYISAGFQISTGVRWTLDFANRPPTAKAGGSYAGNEGGAILFNGQAGDATPTGVLTSSWSFSDGTVGTGLTTSHAFADDGSYTAALVVNDGEFTVADEAAVTVSNVAPIVSVGPGSSFAAGTTHVLQAGFADPGTLDAPWSYAVNWGDGTKNTVGNRAAAGALAGSHTYKQAGVFNVTVVVTDKDGGIGTGGYTVTVTKRGGR